MKCNIGYLLNPDDYKTNLKVKCPNCKKHSCFKCKEKVMKFYFLIIIRIYIKEKKLVGR